ncbi:hypothetical protein HL666_09925 [Bradyrhizobium sp. 83002]|uniref:hypothetical protein n=1 Tax=Bradyrhizobium aeschynomenes TaxID=2734909 RepID=UPI0015524C30|nr:hypothetical protein [Bradyrhizobium aeschynomenes]NPU11080.1 hypothetical protein [Bradyrhizobium aeschynomenes]
MIKTSLADPRTWVICWLFCCAAYTGAGAGIIPCPPSAMQAIIFEHVPSDIDAPVAIEATIDDQAQASDASGRPIVVLNARIERVIKGSLDAETLKILVYPGACTLTGVGRGIIIGKLRDDPLRGLMLEAMRTNIRDWSKEFSQKQMKLLQSAVCRTNESGGRECRLVGP